MKLITPADADLVATLAMCARMGNARRVLTRLRDRFEDPRADPQAVYEYGLCRAVYLLNDRNDTDKGPHQIAAVQAFTRCLDLDPAWWLPRFLRIELSSVLVGAVPTGEGALTGGGGEPPDRDLDTLLALQAEVADPPPYFASTHAARLRARLRAGSTDGSTDGPAVGAVVGAAVEEFTVAARAVGPAPVRSPLPYLDLPFRESVLLLRHLGRAADADRVKATGLAIYAGSLPLQVA